MDHLIREEYGIASTATADFSVPLAPALPRFNANEKSSLIVSVTLHPSGVKRPGSLIRSGEQVMEIALRQGMDVDLPRQKLMRSLIKGRVKTYIDYHKDHMLLSCAFMVKESAQQMAAHLSEYIKDDDYDAYKRFMTQLGIAAEHQPERAIAPDWQI